MSEPDSTTTELRQWQVAGGIVVRDGSVLLVENVRRNGSVDWSPPGGVVDPGESPIEGLTREVREETGLVVSKWSELAYRVIATAPDAGFRLEVHVFAAEEYGGELEIDDPDGIVVSAKYVPVDRLSQQMSDGPRWVAEPLVSYLTATVEAGHLFEYSIGGKGTTQQVDRID